MFHFPDLCIKSCFPLNSHLLGHSSKKSQFHLLFERCQFIFYDDCFPFLKKTEFNLPMLKNLNMQILCSSSPEKIMSEENGKFLFGLYSKN